MPRGPSRSTAILTGLLLLLLLPALFYSAYELSTLSESERLVTEVYRRQLDGILFSLNQYSWDVASGWSAGIVGTISRRAGKSDTLFGERVERIIERSPGLRAVVLCDTSGRRLALFPRSSGIRSGTLDSTLRSARPLFSRLVDLLQMEYRRLEPLRCRPDEGGGREILVLFATGSADPAEAIGGLLLNDSLFVDQILGPRIREAAGAEFLLAVTRSASTVPLLATGIFPLETMGQSRPLWLAPDLALGIRLAGESLDEVARGRFRRNLILIVGLDVVLIAASIFIFRALRRDMAFAKMKSDFVSSVSHDLRTPLALIRLYAETLEMERIQDPSRRRQYLRTIVRETERLGRLVANILSFSRIEAGRMPYRLEQVDLNGAVTQILGSYGDHLREKGFVPEIRLAPDLPPIRADAEALQEALINLIDNGMKYSGENRHLGIVTGNAEGMAFVEVVDHGIGIDRKEQQKIFDMFYRVPDGSTQSTRGSGLGLSVVRHVMDAHGGLIRLTSAPGAGSTFRLLFPYHSNTPEHTSRGTG